MVEGCYIWQDKEVNFDVKLTDLQPQKGEVIVDSINAVEDTQGNNGYKGNMLITNLRLVWFQDEDQHTNISIGYDCIVSVDIQTIESRLKGKAPALIIRTKHNQKGYLFKFASLVEDSPRLFTSFQAVVRSYETTKMYREVKLRNAIIQDRMLNLLPLEQVYNKHTKVINISAEQQAPGTLIITNVRVVWFAQLSDSFNASIPWVQISKVKIRDSTHGKAIVFETHPNNNGYMAGFKSENYEKIFTELSALLKVHSVKPVLGIETVFEEKEVRKTPIMPRTTDDVQIVSDDYKAPSTALYSYMTQNEKQDRPVVFSRELGLAVEQPPEGVTLSELWRTII